MPRIVRQLVPFEAKYGVLSVSKLRSRGWPLPGPSQPVTIIDDSDGHMFRRKMHSAQARIDGLMELHQKHDTRAGQTVTIEADASEPGAIHVLFESTPVSSGRSPHTPEGRRRDRLELEDIPEL